MKSYMRRRSANVLVVDAFTAGLVQFGKKIHGDDGAASGYLASSFVETVPEHDGKPGLIFER